jgi:hypothetical protein
VSLSHSPPCSWFLDHCCLSTTLEGWR